MPKIDQTVSVWNFLQPGDTIDVIAPSSPPTDIANTIQEIQKYFSTTGLNVRIPDGLMNPTPVLDEANTIEERVSYIKQTLSAQDSKAVWAIMGGAWGTELLDALKAALPTNLPVKPVLGYSDVTALHVFFNQYLKWPSIHCIELGANGDITPAWNQNKIAQVLDVLTGNTPSVKYTAQVINQDKVPNILIPQTSIVGSNSLVVNCLNGSNDFTLDTENKIIFLESIARSPGEVSRALNGFLYSPLFQKAQAILLGSFIVRGGQPNTPEEEQQFGLLRERLGNNLSIPVLYSDTFGHGPINNPLPLNTVTSVTQTAPGTVEIEVSANYFVQPPIITNAQESRSESSNQDCSSLTLGGLLRKVLEKLKRIIFFK